MDPLRAFVRSAYAAKTPMVGLCFGHQIMADALGGEVRKSEKGWGLGRHVYEVMLGSRDLRSKRAAFAIACSHQDQVIAPSKESETFLSSTFTPHAGLFYRNGAAISLQSHPEFDDDYTRALAELRRGDAPDDVIETAIASLSSASDSTEMARYLGAFVQRARSRIRNWSMDNAGIPWWEPDCLSVRPITSDWEGAVPAKSCPASKMATAGTGVHS